MSFGDEAGVEFETSRGRDWPSVRQFNVFLANRMGALLELVRKFESTDVRVVSLTVVETADCAIIRLVPSDYERGYEVLTAAKYPFTESDLLVVKLPDDDRPLLTITKALLSAEIDICYMYPLLTGVGPLGNTAIAVHVDDFEAAAAALEGNGFTLFTENDLRE
ncbi:ACT domain-containing protein OS=Singulisphaera acidiphila (strain ATCC BAA-1392 / DSM 18658 / VKM B-2454 / MOB10) GN=Sinac_5680 PE=4 SV=1 [Gemmataceae bacterium]|nr:ACT domain-containing protein OS=Singulisphaera acidiphila (strain ATCC BAA-1392 / DSM 18658 / VKM B-2454 / MOB10) GN=Sinac_5680 PE=4 SV=1 [Gemmataceae bacterium]VTU02144.1 ACT domain-containing protein OS=Singulisphaera acidiphila (strain ATCC BAA-1392 / DSM 18658 / VKM B-2454 / MOB10) GN=Sinac_5680 PE=4 SV=1 [Gemmataceae bacterium]